MLMMIRGQVVSRDDRPVPRATVVLEARDQRSRRFMAIGEARTNADGVFGMQVENVDRNQVSGLRLRIRAGDHQETLSGDPDVEMEGRSGINVDFGKVTLEIGRDRDEPDSDEDDTDSEDSDETEPDTGPVFEQVERLSADRIRELVDDSYMQDVVKLHHDLRLREDEITSLRDRLQETEQERDLRRDELEQVRNESKTLRDQLDGEVEVESLYANVGRQLQQASRHLRDDGIPYRLGKVSLKVKALVGNGGNRLFMPNLADFPRVAEGALADMTFEFHPTEDAAVDAAVAVPDFSGLTETAARRLAQAAGLRLEPAHEDARERRDVGAGQAFKQTPSKGASVPRDSTVLVVFAQV